MKSHGFGRRLVPAADDHRLSPSGLRAEVRRGPCGPNSGLRNYSPMWPKFGLAFGPAVAGVVQGQQREPAMPAETCRSTRATFRA